MTEKHKQLQVVKGHKNNLLYKGQQEKTALEGKQTEQQQVVQGLQKQQKTIQAVIADQRKKDAAINAQIDRLTEYLNTYENLFCIGRNGQHRYNNMDHSMLSAMEA